MMTADQTVIVATIRAHRQNLNVPPYLADGKMWRHCHDGCAVQMNPATAAASPDHQFVRHQAEALRYAGIVRTIDPADDATLAATIISQHSYNRRAPEQISEGVQRYQCSLGCLVTRTDADPAIVQNLFLPHQAVMLTAEGFRSRPGLGDH